MKKIKKKIIYSIFFAFSMVILMQKSADANTINNIDMEVFINKSGSASITETWDAYLDSGTEGYRSFSKMEDRDIYYFSVTDDQGIQYQNTYWLPNSSFGEKAYKCAIQGTRNEPELCWGISKYGKRRYTLKYGITNLVTQYKDAQGIYFNFLNLNQPIGNANITIKSEIPLNNINSKIWAFGNNGSINFRDNNIVMSSNGPLNEKQYMVGLVKFESNFFETISRSRKTFNQIYKSATSQGFNSGKINLWILFILGGVFFVFILWIYAKLSVNLEKKQKKYYGYLFGGKGMNKLPNNKNVPYYRDLPCNNRIEIAYWVAWMYNVIPEKKLNQGIIGAYLLKWIKQGKIKVSKTNSGTINDKDNNYIIEFSENVEFDFKSEKIFFEILMEAAGENNVLETKELKKYCKKHYGRIMSWLNIVKEIARDNLQKNGYLRGKTIVKKSFFKSRKLKMVTEINEKTRIEAIKLKGLKKYLLDFSKISDRTFEEVHIWDDYLIFAHLLGIADKVSKQFSKLTPKLNDNIQTNIFLSSIVASNISLLAYSNAERYHMRHEISSHWPASGSGGSSFSGGGSSAGGSSGGGFR